MTHYLPAAIIPPVDKWQREVCIVGADGRGHAYATAIGETEEEADARALYLARALSAHDGLLAALRIARDYVQVDLEEIREGQAELDERVPSRTALARKEDADTIALMEGHLAQIDEAIAKATSS